jgi:hypothetical protein
LKPLPSWLTIPNGLTVAAIGFGLKMAVDVLSTAALDESSIGQLAAFLTLGYFLISDWISARDIDRETPDTPNPMGMRFWLDCTIALVFILAFIQVRDCARGFLAPTTALIFILGATWSAVIGRGKNVAKRVAKTCNAYFVSHIIGALGFVLLGAHCAATGASAAWAVWLWVVVYILWEGVDRLVVGLVRPTQRRR